MTTLKDTWMPEPRHLRDYLNAECPEKTDEQLVSDFIKGIAKYIAITPKMYRSYGPYWPAIKKMIIENVPDAHVGKNLDADILAIYSYSEPALTCAAATLYHERRIAQGHQNSTQHILPVDAHETYELNYSDEEMELKIAFG